MSRGAGPSGSGDPRPALSLAFSLTANAGAVSDEELEQMLDSGQSEVFVSNVSDQSPFPANAAGMHRHAWGHSAAPGGLTSHLGSPLRY